MKSELSQSQARNLHRIISALQNPHALRGLDDLERLVERTLRRHTRKPMRKAGPKLAGRKIA